MALTRITKGVIKPNENYDTHNINSTGIVTAVGANFTGNVSVGGTLTYEDVTSIDSVGIITAQNGIDCNGDLDVDGHTNLDNVSIAGVTTITSSASSALYVAGRTVLGNNQLLPSFGAGTLAVVSNLSGNGNWVDLSILGGRSGRSIIKFGDHDDQDMGAIKYYHTDNSLNFTTNGSSTERLKINSTGNVEITNDLDVDGHTNLDNVSIAGVTTMGQTTIFTTGGTTLLLKDSDSTNPADRSGIAFVDQNSTQTAFIGKESDSDAVLTINNTNTINPIRLKVNNTTRLEVGNTGLYVTGTLTVTGTLSAGGTLYIPDDIQHTGDTNTKIRFPAADTISFETDATERLRIDSSGRVGIGTDNPNARLRIHDNSDNNTIVWISGADIVTEYLSLGIQTGKAILRGGGSGSTNCALSFETSTSGTESEKMRLDANGTLKIGTSLSDTHVNNVPAGVKFFVNSDRTGNYGGLYTNSLIFDSQTAAVDAGGTLTFAGFSGTNPTAKAAIRGGNEGTPSSQSGYFAVFTRPSSGSLDEKMRVTSTGLVGIGINNPSSPGSYTKFLEVSHNNSASIIVSRSASGTAHKLEMGVFSGASLIESTGTTSLRFKTNSAERLRIKSDGKIGIGHHAATQISHELTIRPANDGGISIKRPGDTASTPSTHLNITTTTSGSAFPSGEAYTVKYKTNNCDALFETHSSGGTGGNFSFRTGTSSGNLTERLRINSSGAVMINTTNSSSRTLNLKGTFGILSTSQTGVLDMSVTDAGEASIAPYVAGGSALIFKTNVSGAGVAERLRIGASGNVGINQNSPYYKLHLNFTDNTTSLSGGTGGNWGGNGIRIENDSTTTGAMALAHFRVYSADWHIGNKYVSTSPDKSDFVFIHEGTEEALRIQNDGKVGINTTAPTGKLEVVDPGNVELLTLKRTSGNSGTFNVIIGGADPGTIFTTTGISDDFIFRPGGSERLRINNTGWMGAGQSTRGHNGEVAAFKNTSNTNSWLSVNVNNNTGIGGVVFGDSDAWAPAYVQYNHTAEIMQFISNGNERLRIKSDGSIQTTTRSAGLRRMILAGSPTNTSFNIEVHDGATGTASGTIQGELGLYYNDGSTLADTATIKFERGNGAANGEMTFFTNNSERLRIKSDGTSVFTGKISNSSSYTTHNANFYGGNTNNGGVRIEVGHNNTTVSGNTAIGSFPHHLNLTNYSKQNTADDGMVTIGFDIPTTSSHANGVIAYQATAPGTGDFSFHTESGNTIFERLRITSAGIIGVNKNNPNLGGGGNGIHIASSGVAELHLTGSQGSASTDGLQIQMNGNIANIINRETGSIKFYTGGANSGNERLRIGSTGTLNYYLGSQNSNNFQINGHASQGRTTFAVKAGNASSGSITSMRLMRSNDANPVSIFIDHSSNNFQMMNSVDAGDFILHLMKSGSGSSLPKFRVNNDGKTSLGDSPTGSPQATLHVRNSGDVSTTLGGAPASIMIEATTNASWSGGEAGAELLFKKGGDITGAIRNEHDRTPGDHTYEDAGLAFYTAPASESPTATRKFRVLSTGNADLTGTLSEGSDIRLKTDVVGITSALSKVNQIRGVEYKWNSVAEDNCGIRNREDGVKEIGVIADEIESIIPQVIKSDTVKGLDGTEYKGVSYDRLVPLLIEAVKELSAKVTALEGS